jgi:formate dehydrogenase alpha subunit
MPPYGGCRLCIVEIENMRGLPPSCTTPATDGMIVNTHSEKVVQVRKTVLELLLAYGDHNCLMCEQTGNCELQDLVYEHGLEKVRFKSDFKPKPKDESNSMIIRDQNKCVLCGRCVRGCLEVQVNGVIDVAMRGSDSFISTFNHSTLKDSNCVFCGECVNVCPTGALTYRQARFKGRPWELTKTVTTCTYCGVGCQLELNVKDNKIVKVTASETIPGPNKGSLCIKGRFAYDFIDHPDRLTTPLIAENGSFREASWDEALDLVARKLANIKAKSGPDTLAFFSSARVTNEENYLMNKFARAVIGTNNVDHCARLCHASTVAGLAASFGSGAMTNTIDELQNTDVILVTGSNTTEMHPVFGSAIKRAVKSGKSKLIVVDGRKIDLVDHAEMWLRHKPGSDVAWLNGMMHVIIKEELYAKEYVAERTEGFEELKKVVEGYTPEKVQAISGIPKDDLIAAARMYAAAPAACIIYSMGVTQHINGTDGVKSVANLAMLCGNIGIESGGVNPLRGQNNVQGACDMGALPIVYSGYQAVASPEIRQKMADAWAVAALPDKPGLTIVETLNAAAEGKIKGLFIMGENPMISDPDQHHVEEGLKKLDFLVVQDIFLTETAKFADVVLPAACFAEKEGTFTSTERRVQLVRKAVEAPGEARADWEILCDLATRMGYPMKYAEAEAIFSEIAAVTPSYAGMDYPRLVNGGLQWPCPTKDHPGTRFLHKDKFVRGKGLFAAVEWIPPAELPDQEYPFLLTTGRVLYHYHTGTMTRRSVGLNERYPECLVELSQEDAERLNVQDGEMVRVISRRGRIEAKTTVGDMTEPGVVFIPFHFSEAAVNKLTIAALDPIAKIPDLKVCAVKVEKIV